MKPNLLCSIRSMSYKGHAKFCSQLFIVYRGEMSATAFQCLPAKYLSSPDPGNYSDLGATSSGAYGYDPVPDDSVRSGYREAQTYDSRESSPQAEEDSSHFPRAPSLHSAEALKTKDDRPRQRAPKKYRHEFPDEEAYQQYKREMDKNRQQKKRNKDKERKEQLRLNAGNLFQQH